MWVGERLAPLGEDPARLAPQDVVAKLVAADPQIDLRRLDRYRRGQVRLKAVQAVQQRLVCEGLLSPERFTPSVFDLPTHRGLADFERKNDIFGWGFVSGETRDALMRPPLDLHFDTFHRIVAERVAAAAGILEDGSVAKSGEAPTYVDEAGSRVAVPDLIGGFVAVRQTWKRCCARWARRARLPRCASPTGRRRFLPITRR